MTKSQNFSSNHGVANSWCRAPNHEIFDFKSFIVTASLMMNLAEEKDMKENSLIDLSLSFATDIVKLCEKNDRGQRSVLFNQLIRSGTSIGANIYEGNYASSKADFINKFQIALKECYETEYWLTVFKNTEYISSDEHTEFFAKCSKIRRLLVASIKTAKSKN